MINHQSSQHIPMSHEAMDQGSGGHRAEAFRPCSDLASPAEIHGDFMVVTKHGDFYAHDGSAVWNGGVKGSIIELLDQLGWNGMTCVPIPMTDPWCWYIYANIKGLFLDGIHGTPYIAPWILRDGVGGFSWWLPNSDCHDGEYHMI